MTNRTVLSAAFSLLVLLLLSSCAAPSGLSQADQIATSVVATLGVSAQPTVTGGEGPTAEPIDGEILPESNFGDCANTGQISIAYVKNGGVWLWVQGGAPVLLVNTADANDVRISQDGCRIAYALSVPNPAFDPNSELPLSERISELWVVNSDGVGARKMAGLEFLATLPAAPENSTYDLYRFDWQPVSHTLAFGTRLSFAGPGLSQNNDIYLVDADTAIAPEDVSTLLPMGQGGDFYFSPDGLQVAFTTAQTVSVINTDSSNLRSNLVNFPTVITYSEYLYYPPVHWGLDNNSFMLAIPPEDGLAAPVNGVYPETSLWYVPLDGTPVFEAGAVQSVWFSSVEIQFSPDNGRIGYTRPYGEQQANLGELVVALSNGSNESEPVQLPQVIFRAWGPDNNQYIYSYMDPAFHLYLGSAGSPNVQPISGLTPFEAFNAELNWIEGTTFVQLLNGNAGAELSLMDTSGAGVVIDNFVTPFVSFDVAN